MAKTKEREVIELISKCIQILGGQSDILSSINSWRAEMSDDDTIAGLSAYIRGSMEQEAEQLRREMNNAAFDFKERYDLKEYRLEWENGIPFSKVVATELVNHENLHLSEEVPKTQPIVQTTEKHIEVIIDPTDIREFRVVKTNKTPISYKLNIHLETLAKCKNLAEAIKMVGEVPPFPLVIENIQFVLDYPLHQSVMIEIRRAESVIGILYYIARVYMDIIYGSQTNEYGIWGHGIEDLVFEGIDIQESNSSLFSKIYLGS